MDAGFAAGLHWFWAAFFFAFGALLIAKGRGFGSARAAFRPLRIAADGGAGDCDERIRKAINRREQAEGPGAPIGWWGGGAALVLGIVAAVSAVPDALLYALLCLVLAVVSAAYFVRLRNTQRKRVAALSVRAPEQVIPAYWFVLAVAVALSALVYAGRPGLTLGSLLVCASSLIVVFIAWRLTHLGAILSGTDLPAEQLVDDRLRSYRSCMVLTLAFVQPFVFMSQILQHAGWWQIGAYALSWIGWLAFWVRLMVSQRRVVHLA